MTDSWCFTCDHEIRQDINGTGTWVHLHEDDETRCICLEDEIPCDPR